VEIRGATIDRRLARKTSWPPVSNYMKPKQFWLPERLAPPALVETIPFAWMSLRRFF
jgi:hypothetical protein